MPNQSKKSKGPSSTGFIKLSPEQQKASMVSFSEEKMSASSSTSSSSSQMTQIVTRKDPLAKAQPKDEPKLYVKVTSKEENSSES